MLDYQIIKESLIVKIPSEKKLVDLIQRLSQQFTINRDKIDEYWDNAELVAAYALFYFPTNYAKFSWALGKIGSDFVSDNLEVIDVGTGPGTFLHAFKDHFPQIKKFIGIEHSKYMRQQAETLWIKAFGNLDQCEFISSANNLAKTDNKRLLIFGHSLNEMPEGELQKILNKIKPDYILFIEPGTKESFSKIKEARRYLLEKDFKVFYPCPSDAPCPMENTDNWCHQYVMATYEPEVERLCQLVKLDRRHMPVIMHFYGKEGDRKELSSNEAFIVQTFPETKFSVEWEVCRNHKKSEIEHLQILKRNLSKKDVKDLKNLYAGDYLSFEIEKEISENSIRLKNIKALP